VKKFKKTVILSLVFVLSFITTAHAQTNFTSYLSVKQEKPNWCWDAIAQCMAATRYYPGYKSQSEICQYVFGHSEDTKGTIDDMSKGARYATDLNFYFAVERYTYSLTSIRSKIDSNWTIGTAAYNDYGGGHAFGIVGYDTDYSQIYLVEPNPNRNNCWITVYDYIYVGANADRYKWKYSVW
jgi:hypothetical protein